MVAISGATLGRGIVGYRLPGDHNRIKQLYLFFHPFKNVLKCKKANARPRRGRGCATVERGTTGLETPESRRRKRRRRKRKRGGERWTRARERARPPSEEGCQGVTGGHRGVPAGGWVVTARPGAAEQRVKMQKGAGGLAQYRSGGASAFILFFVRRRVAFVFPRWPLATACTTSVTGPLQVVRHHAFYFAGWRRNQPPENAAAPRRFARSYPFSNHTPGDFDTGRRKIFRLEWKKLEKVVIFFLKF